MTEPCLARPPPHCSLPAQTHPRTAGFHRDLDLNDFRCFRLVVNAPVSAASMQRAAEKVVVFVAAHEAPGGGPDWERGAWLVFVLKGHDSYLMSAVMAGGLALFEAGVVALDGDAAKKTPVFHRPGGQRMPSTISSVLRVVRV